MHRGRWALVGLVGLAPGTALAQGGDKAIAEALFSSARDLAAKGDYAAACPKFAESQKLDPATGTLLNLADCYEKVGKTASAWSAWLEAAAVAKDRGQVDRERLARQRAADLLPTLSYITVQVPEASRVEGLSVTSNGESVREALWDTPIPVDPGTYLIAASAPGRRSWQAEVSVAKQQPDSSIVVPTLGTEQPATGAQAPAPVAPAPTPEPAPPPAEPAPPPQPQLAAAEPPPAQADQMGRGSAQRTWGYVVGGVGLVGIGVGTYFGLRAMSKYDESKKDCRTDTLCGPDGVDTRDEAIAAGNVSTVSLGIGIAALGTGVILLLTAPSDPEPAAVSSPTLSGQATLGRDGGFFSLTGVF